MLWNCSWSGNGYPDGKEGTMTRNIPKGRRLIIVSNRLPFTISLQHNELVFGSSAGGLVTGLSAFLESLASSPEKQLDHIWIGWPGASIDESMRGSVAEKALAEFHSYPVFLSESDMEMFYHGFCNKTIWPLFHYFPSYTAYSDEQWQNYRHVNKIFCDALADIVRPDDIVWVHDYHLMLLPQMLRGRFPSVPIGFFLHIPFPSFEMFRLLPRRWRTEILEGLLGADLVGFHAYEYMEHFLQSSLRILGHEHHIGQIALPDHLVNVETYPMGIDFQQFHQESKGSAIAMEEAKLRDSLGNVKVVLSVDRLDYSKGILNRLQGFELLLQTHPEFRGKVVLVMVVVPSRIGVDQYELMKRQVEECVGRINGEFGSVSWTPVIYQFRSLPRNSLLALYRMSDAALVTPLRDGMNLIAKEYVATRTDQTGVLILSEMAGAVKEMGEAIVINPNDREEIAEALLRALVMPVDEQIRRNRIMQERLRRYDVIRWANEFVEQLHRMRAVQKNFNAKMLVPSLRSKIIQRFVSADRRLLLLDYDGTLVPLADKPHLAGPDESVLNLLKALAANPRNAVVIISGRDRETLEQWLGHLPVDMVAEHGIWHLEQGGTWQTQKPVANEWKQHLLPILQLYADRLPGAHVEEKSHSLAWHFRTADPKQARPVANELTDHLKSFTANLDIQVLQGSKVVEVRVAGINKGTAARHWVARDDFGFILCIGDDWTDEDMFAAMPESACSIRVGVTNTLARYNVRDSAEVNQLLSLFAQAASEGVRYPVLNQEETTRQRGK